VWADWTCAVGHVDASYCSPARRNLYASEFCAASRVTERVRLVVYTVRGARNGREAIRIISARQASRRERKAYGRPGD
jgi:uncharacterized DUF497 family protein